MLGIAAGVRAGIANVSRAVTGRTGIDALAAVTALEGAAAASDPGGLQAHENVVSMPSEHLLTWRVGTGAAKCHRSVCATNMEWQRSSKLGRPLP